MPDPIRLALIADIHHGGNVLSKKGEVALDLLMDFCKWADKAGVQAVVDLGDRISDVDFQKDKHLLSEVAEVFRRLALPKFHLLGNHDTASLSREDNEELLGAPLKSRSFDMQGWHLVFWQADTSQYWPHGCTVLHSDLVWLERDLAVTDLPTVIFTHIPLDGGSMEGNYYFQENPRLATYGELEAVRRIIHANDHVLLCVAGHVHWNRITEINGTVYISQHSLTESFTMPPHPSGAWGMLELGERLHWRVFGRDPFQASLNLKFPRKSWSRPLPPFRSRRPEGKSPGLVPPIGAVLFDLDGVFYTGDHPLPGGREILELLEEKGIPYMALTNNARHAPEFYAARLKKMGVRFPKERILTSAEAAVHYVMNHYPDSGVHVLGSPWLKRCFQSFPAPNGKGPAVVVVGMVEELSLEDLSAATILILNGAALVITNPDPIIPASEGWLPECGPLAAYLEAATGKKGEVVGKPSPFLFHRALEKLSVPADQTIMVGDTQETDIDGALRSEIRSVLVCPAPQANTMADLCVRDLTDLAQKLSPILEDRRGV